MKKKKSIFLKKNNIKILFFSSTITFQSNCCAIIKKGPRRGEICGKQLKKENALYCGLHTLKKKCIGITKKGISCNSSVKKEELYCYLHNNTNAIKKNFFHDNVNTVCHLDCIQGLKKIKDNSVSIIICDPPYNIGKDFGNDSDKQTFDQYLNWCNKWLKQCIRILKEDGTLFIYGFSETLSYIQTKCLKKVFVRWLVWHYTNKTSPNSKYWQRSFESILSCSKKKIPFFNIDLCRESYSDAYKKTKPNKKRVASTKSRFGNQESIYLVNELGALPRDVIKIPTLAGGNKKEKVNHPTQKPLALCEKLIKATINKEKNFLVVPFSGSGSEVVAAKKLGIPFIGFEINKNYIEITEKRLNTVL